MSDSQEPLSQNASVKSANHEQNGIEIEISKLSDNQKIASIGVIFVLIIQIVYLLNLSMIINFFKGMMSVSYQPLADYVLEFLDMFVLYVLFLFIFFALYSLYVIFIKDEQHMKFLYHLWYYLIVLLFVDFVLFFMSDSTSNPYTIELFMALFVIMLSLIIALVPFGLYELLTQRTRSSTS